MNPKFSSSLDTEDIQHIPVGYDSLSRSKALAILDGALQKPDYATAANPGAGGFFPVKKGSLYTFLLPKSLS